MVSRYQTLFISLFEGAESDLTYSLLTTSFLEKSIFGKKAFFHLFSVYMILTDSNISQSKIGETSQFVFIPANIGLLMRNTIFAKTIRP